MAASLLARIFAQSASISARIIDRILASPAANAARGYFTNARVRRN
jgi:hypothetical protein